MRFLILLLTLLIFTITKAQPLRVGTIPYNPPFEIEADKAGHFFGFDVDIMDEICNRLQADCHFIPLKFENIFSELAAGHIDLGLAAISIVESREQNFLFSLPYMASSGQFLTKSTSPISSLDDIQGKKIGLTEGTIFKAIVLTSFGKQARIYEYPTLQAVLQALSNNKVDVIIDDEEAAKNWVATNNKLFKLVGEGIPIGVGYGIMANKKDQDLINRVNKALLEMEEDGHYLKIYNRYFAKLSS